MDFNFNMSILVFGENDPLDDLQRQKDCMQISVISYFWEGSIMFIWHQVSIQLLLSEPCAALSHAS